MGVCKDTAPRHLLPCGLNPATIRCTFVMRQGQSAHIHLTIGALGLYSIEIFTKRSLGIMPNPTAAMLVIGDEILSGRTRDANMHYLAGELTKHGIDLKEVRIVPDDHDRIVEAVNVLRDGYDHVFSSGGIGPTHDDVTADAVAAAFDDPIDVREDARILLTAHYARSGLQLNAARMRMARIPDSATLIENPVSAAPGFTIGNMHVMAGVPSVFQAMLSGVLRTLPMGAPLVSASVRVNRGEGDIAGPLEELAKRYPDLSIGSYPFRQEGCYGVNVVFRGADAVQVTEAANALRDLFPKALV